MTIAIFMKSANAPVCNNTIPSKIGPTELNKATGKNLIIKKYTSQSLVRQREKQIQSNTTKTRKKVTEKSKIQR